MENYFHHTQTDYIFAVFPNKIQNDGVAQVNFHIHSE